MSHRWSVGSGKSTALFNMQAKVECAGALNDAAATIVLAVLAGFVSDFAVMEMGFEIFVVEPVYRVLATGMVCLEDVQQKGDGLPAGMENVTSF